MLNVKSDHLGLRGIDTLEELAEVKRIPIEVARDTAVLNADDPLCLAMADYTEAKIICYVTMNPSTRWCASTSAPADGRSCSRRASTGR